MTLSNDSSPNRLRRWRFLSRDYQLGRFPLVMGILNATPDSFSDGGKFLEINAAVEHGLKLAEDGADLIDIGGESTRPGSAAVSLEEELSRTIPVIELLAAQTAVPISIDTTKSEVARQAIAAGAEIINDISGLTFDSAMINACAETGAGVICMHIKGTPQDMQDEPHYEDVVSDVRDFLQHRLEVLSESGIPADRVVVDPGIGFGKTAEHNLQLLANVESLRSLGRPVLIGHSRKRFLSKVLGRSVEERTAGTIGVAIAAASQSADIIRVHDVQAVRDSLTAWHAVTSRVDMHDRAQPSPRSDAP